MNVLVVYFSTSGKTETMAGYIAEGVRFSGNQATIKKISEIREPVEELSACDGILIGSPTFSQDAPHPVRDFLAAGKDSLAGKLAGTFGPYHHDIGYRHDTHAPDVIISYLENDMKVKPFSLGPFHLQEDIVETQEGMKACQDYGRVFGEQLGH